MSLVIFARTTLVYSKTKFKLRITTTRDLENRMEHFWQEVTSWVLEVPKPITKEKIIKDSY